MAPRAQRRPRFVWQAILILLPVVVLTVIGALSLRQDKILAEHDARERAQVIAEHFLQQYSQDLVSLIVRTNLSYAFNVNEAGELVSPPPWDPIPQPRPSDPSRLTPAQSQLWQQAQRAISGTNLAAAAHAIDALIDSNPPAEFGAAACYDLAVSYDHQGHTNAAAAFRRVFETYPDTLSESGIPFRSLAEFKLLDHAPQPGTAELMYSNLVSAPTPLTPYFLERLPDSEMTLKWRRIWQMHETARAFYSAAFPTLQSSSSGSHLPPAFWFTTSESVTTATPLVQFPERSWLAIRLGDPGTNQTYVCVPESELGLHGAKLATTDLPNYFGISMEIAGKTVREFAPDLHLWSFRYGGGGKSSGREITEKLDAPATNVLATATSDQSGAALKATVYLTSPAKLYQRQRARQFWFGLLVATSTIAALIGLVSAGRAFAHQRSLNEMKSNFVSSVSHELRAPIASVRLMAESLERGKISEPDKQNAYFRFIGQECRRLSSLIENVLDFARIEQGRKQYDFEPTDITALTNETVKLMEPYASEKGVKLELETSNIEHQTPNIEANVDGRAIQQVLVNLIDNAIKHSPKGSSVTIQLEQSAATISPPATRHLSLAVSDQGPGIPREEHEKIFERFYRRGSELHRETQGVGIGLSIVKHIVEAHDGIVSVESEPGKGSRFTVELPIKNETTDEHR